MHIDTLSLADAKAMIAAGEAKAAEIGRPMNLAVVDAGGNLVAHVRMDGAWLGSIDVSINKAFTARAFDMPTNALWEHTQSGKQAFGIQHSNGGRIMAFAGGFPIIRGGAVVGAIGISGGYGHEDDAVAEAAIAALADAGELHPA